MAIVKDAENVFAVFVNDNGDVVIRTVKEDANNLPIQSVVIPAADLDDLRYELEEIASGDA